MVSANGRARLTFGPGVVPDRTPVRIEPISTVPNDFRLVAGTAYRVISGNVVLAKPADLLLRYDPAAIPGGVADVLEPHLLEGDTWTPAGTARVDTAAKTVTTSVQRLAIFALLGQGPASSIEAEGTPSTEGGVGGTLSTPPRVRVTNILGTALRRAVVRFTVVEGNGTLGVSPVGSIDVFTDSAGRATAPAWRLGRAGPNAIAAAVAGLPPLTFHANGIAFLSIVVGGAHTCAIDFEREAWCWGENARGELGTGQGSGALPTPQRVTGSQRFAALSAAGGTHTCGTPESGQLLCWGWNGYGSLGDGTFLGYKSAPTPVSGPTSFRTVSAGYLHTCALTDAGESILLGMELERTAGRRIVIRQNRAGARHDCSSLRFNSCRCQPDVCSHYRKRNVLLGRLADTWMAGSAGARDASSRGRPGVHVPHSGSQPCLWTRVQWRRVVLGEQRRGAVRQRDHWCERCSHACCRGASICPAGRRTRAYVRIDRHRKCMVLGAQRRR